MGLGLLFKGSVAPAAEDDPEALAEEHERRGLTAWVKRNPALSIAGIVLLVLGIIAAVVVPVTCSLHGCPPKQPEAAKSPLYDGAPLRLVAAFLDDKDVLDFVPAILQQYTSRVKMELSNLQILEALDESVLEIVLAEVKKYSGLDFVVRDFILRAPNSSTTARAAKDSSSTALDDATADSNSSSSSSSPPSDESTSATNNSSSSNLRRSRLQATTTATTTTTTTTNYSLNDPGLTLNSSWWFTRINVTGAWSQLGLSTSAPQTRTSDVVIAVTDSGALVTHPDLTSSWWVNPGETDGDLRDNDGNGFIDDVYGACFSTKQCSPTYTGSNVSRCGIGPSTAAWNGVTDKIGHGTKIAGLIGARPKNGIGVAGVAPNLRQMILKVTDETIDPANPPYAYSDVVRAVDYAYGKGARIFSMSFGNDAKYSMNLVNKPALDAAASAYRNLFNRYNNALFVAAAGNEWTNLDSWRAANYTYSPCMVDTPNTLCVGGTAAPDALFYSLVLGQQVGTNWGPTTVDLAAPAANIYTTDLSYSNYYSTVNGTSFSAPITAAVAGLVLAALGGQSRATSTTPLQIKNILLSSGDTVPALQGMFRSARRLNAGNAVAAALTLAATNRTVLKMDRTVSSLNASVALQGWEYYWWSGTASDASFDAFGSDWTFIDYYVRGQLNSNFNVFRYGSQTFTLATALVRIDTPGVVSLQARTSAIDPTRWQLSLGENVMLWKWANSSFGSVDVLFPSAGYYNMTLRLYCEYGTTINLLWQLPGASSFTSPSIFWVVHEDPPSSRYYDPGVTPRPALWHVVWNEASDFDDFSASGNRGYFVLNSNPQLYRDAQATVTDFSFTTGTDLRNALYGTNGAPSNNQTVVYGYARANLRPLNFSSGISFRMQGPHTRLYINGQGIFDLQSDSQLQTVTPCVTLRNGTAHEIYFYFAARVNSSNPVGLTWASCTASSVPSGNSGAYASMTSSLATNFFWQPTNITSLPRGFRCDAWPANLTVSAVGTTPQYGTPAKLTWMYPRDCPAANRVTSGSVSECRMATVLQTLFPNITWNVWSIRCFTYYAASISGGKSRAQNLGGPVFQHLAGVRVYEQWGDGLSFASMAPAKTRFGSVLYQLYVIEWVAMGQMWNRLAGQTVWDGTLDAGNSSSILTTNSNAMILPAAALAPMSWQDVTSV
ncbi:hypothetical protein Agub_g10138 [Astrephomene gubernaculifera]|uniref:Peptidase S8/S53 domain-containing protein n=1 Tax=Astrephomene gubernaculifera TaxID=47775 RepID=A0AAD3DW82_9CHLO|nr:hypothetical protein Agub_g10138 [Astrephomene gubernaculifera]